MECLPTEDSAVLRSRERAGHHCASEQGEGGASLGLRVVEGECGSWMSSSETVEIGSTVQGGGWAAAEAWAHLAAFLPGLCEKSWREVGLGSIRKECDKIMSLRA